MHTTRIRRHITALIGALIVLSLVIVPARADHAWGPYHWQRTTSGPLTLDVVDNTRNGWTTELKQTLGEWDAGTLGGPIGALDFNYVTGNPNIDPKKCGPVVKTIQVCNANYGGNGWMGIAQIWASGSHITQANAKLNDYYFTPSWYTGFGTAAEQDATLKADRLLVMCQEIAHAWGLDHQDEDHYNQNLGSCMDYTVDPNGGESAGWDGKPFTYGDSNEHPNEHDWEMLALIYNHTDTVSTTSGKGGKNRAEPAPQAEEALGNSASQWGEVIVTDGQGRPSHYKKNLGGGRVAYTFVIYADNSPDAQGGAGSSGGGHSDDGTVDDGAGGGAVDDGGRNDGGRDGGKRDGAKQDGGRDGGKRDGAKQDGGRDGDKRDGARQRQGHDHDRHNH